MESAVKGHDSVFVLGARHLVLHAREHLLFIGHNLNASSLVASIVNDGILESSLDCTGPTHCWSNHVETGRSHVNEALLEQLTVISSRVEALGGSVGYNLSHLVRLDKV